MSKSERSIKFMNVKINHFVIGILLSVGMFLVFGTVTALIPNPWFTRMTGLTFLDYFFLIVSSALMGSYIALHLHQKKKSMKCNTATYTGGVGSFLAFSCPVCNKLLVLLFGTTTLLAYFEPYRPVLGFLSIGLLTGALYFKLKRYS